MDLEDYKGQELDGLLDDCHQVVDAEGQHQQDQGQGDGHIEIPLSRLHHRSGS